MAEKKKKTERLRKGNMWMICVACGYREQFREVDAVGTPRPITCPACGVQVLNVETKTTRSWAP
jgi:DNA-directed RNA polymerase subunit RPC12/RpoP